MDQYLKAMHHIMKTGVDRTDRTGVGTRSVFGHQMRFDLKNDGFPAVTTKKLAWRSVVSELLWFLEGSTDERRLAEILHEKPREELIGKNTIWTANADHQGRQLGYTNNDLVKELGPVYGSRWRDSEGVDQIENLVQELMNNPHSRRLIVSAWDVPRIPEMTLPPCHCLFQFYVAEDKLSCQLYQRSVDAALGLPFNIASYALLTHMLAQIAGLGVGEFVHTSGDMHIYHNHFDGVKQQLARSPLPRPHLEMPKFTNLEELVNTRTSDYRLVNYQHHPAISMPMAV